jgi:hypothetical protein
MFASRHLVDFNLIPDIWQCRRTDPSLPGAAAQPMLQLASTIRNRNGGSGSGGESDQPILLDFANADVDEIDGFQVTELIKLSHTTIILKSQ